MAHEVFVDTAGWASAFVATETHYTIAARYLSEWQANATQVVTTNYVMAELAALLTSPLRVPRPQQIVLLKALRSASWVTIAHVDAATGAAGFELFHQRPDKTWSLVDCVSFIIMQQRNIQKALTTDQHFEQAGFLRLLKP